MNAIQSIVEGITTYLSEQVNRGIAEEIVCDNLRVDVEMMGQPIKIRLDGSIARIVKASSDEHQAPAPADAPAGTPAWDEEPLLDMEQGTVTVMCRWLLHKKMLRVRPDVALLFLAHLDATATVSWPTIRPPATGGASDIPFALCCWYLEQVDNANDGRLEAAQTWINQHLLPKRRGRPPERQDGAPERQDGAPERQDGAPERQDGAPERQDGAPERRDAEGDNPSFRDRSPFAAYLTRLRLSTGQSEEVVARKLGISVSPILLWEKGHGKPTKATISKLAKFYGVPKEEMLREAGLSE